MNIEVKTLPKSRVELTVTMTPEEIKPHLVKTAQRVSQSRDIKGFRRGKAPYDKIVQAVGEMALLEATIEPMVQATYYSAVKEKGLDVIGMPEINVTKLAPGNAFEFTATAAILPGITLPDFSTISIKKKDATVTDEQVTEALENLRKMRGQEISKDGEAGKEDKVVVDMDLFVDGVAVEGGQTKDHGIYLSEDYYVPGLPEKLLGVKKDEEKEFTLPFPKEHYQKHLAGKDVLVKVKVKDVMERTYPELDQEFAKSIGQENVEKLTALMKENMEHEAKRKEEERQEIELLEKAIEKTTFEEIPDVLLDAEKHRIFHELKSRIAQQGLTIEQYLEGIKKTQDEVMAGFVEQADKRVKTTLILRAVSNSENVEVAAEEIEKEIEIMRGVYKDQPDVLKNLETQDTRESLKSILRNRKTVKLLKEKMGA